jgi:hypothetical protein
MDRQFVEATAGLTSLISYDSLWTGYAQHPDQAPDALGGFLGGFHDTLRAAPDIADVIAEVAQQEQFQQMSDGLRNVLGQDPDGQTALSVVDQHGGVAALASYAAEEIRGATDEELRKLEDEANTLGLGANAGYFGKKFLCGLAKASMAAGIITVWVPPHAHALVAIKAGVVVHKANGC